VKQLVSPLILSNQKIGQRHYFDCYESAFGGMLAYYYNNYDFILKLYSIPDAIALYINQDSSEIILNSRSLDINSFAIENLGFTLIGNSDIYKFRLRSKETPFVVCFDEYYVKENNHYKKEHFFHASLGIEIIDPLHIKVSDPGLKIPKDLKSYCERIISFDKDIINQPDAIHYYLLEKKKDFVKLNQDELFKSISVLNINFWKNIISTNQYSNVYFGMEALSVFKSQLEAFKNINLAAQEFYKWIFPIYWKNHYLQNLKDKTSIEITKILTLVIKEMEIFETNLLRLITSYKQSLHLSSIERWNKICKLLKEYIILEEERVREKYH
jgi:hypothetical protein